MGQQTSRHRRDQDRRDESPGVWRGGDAALSVRRDDTGWTACGGCRQADQRLSGQLCSSSSPSHPPPSCAIGEMSCLNRSPTYFHHSTHADLAACRSDCGRRRRARRARRRRRRHGPLLSASEPADGCGLAHHALALLYAPMPTASLAACISHSHPPRRPTTTSAAAVAAEQHKHKHSTSSSTPPSQATRLRRHRRGFLLPRLFIDGTANHVDHAQLEPLAWEPWSPGALEPWSPGVLEPLAAAGAVPRCVSR